MVKATDAFGKFVDDREQQDRALVDAIAMDFYLWSASQSTTGMPPWNSLSSWDKDVWRKWSVEFLGRHKLAQRVEVATARAPNAAGWWLRSQNDQRQWFYVTSFTEDGELRLGIWWDAIGDFVDIERFSDPLTKWFGPVAAPWPED